MHTFVAIVGRRNYGKSTIIQSLTGAPAKNYRDFIKDASTGKSVYVVCSSPQEDPLALPALQRILDEVVAREGCQGVVMAIQPTFPNVRLSMEDIFQEVANRKFDIFVFVIDPSHSGDAGLSGIVERRLSYLNIAATVLDGRRFAMLNAQLINELTQIVGAPITVPEIATM